MFTSSDPISSKKVAIHPKYDRKTGDYNVAIWELASQIPNAVTVDPLAPNGIPPYESQSGIVCGLGIVDGGDLAQFQANVSISNISDCSTLYGAITPRMFCIDPPSTGLGLCFGDEGGPFWDMGQESPQLYGIMDYPIDCGFDSLPIVATNLSDPEIVAFIDAVFACTFFISISPLFKWTFV